MEFFQRFILGMAIILLIISYVVIFYTTSAKSKEWAPTILDCPDYWETQYSSDGRQITCKSKSTTMSDIVYSIGATCKQKLDLVTSKNIDWAGVTYGINPNSCK
jgi:hypothetical protein